MFHAILRGWLERRTGTGSSSTCSAWGGDTTEVTRHALASVDRPDSGPRPALDWARIIRDRDLDALIYPELGMNETTLALATLRLAPQQLAAWGHPETSGLPTLDGFLSAELFEPPDAQDHYTEPLVRLPNLGVHCEPHGVTPAEVDLPPWGYPRRSGVHLSRRALQIPAAA